MHVCSNVIVVAEMKLYIIYIELLIDFTNCAFTTFKHLQIFEFSHLNADFFFSFALQLKVYEDDFRRERSDKQMLQRLLLKKSPPSKELVLMHRCNNEQQHLGGDKRTKSEETRQQQHHPLCPKNQTRDKE